MLFQKCKFLLLNWQNLTFRFTCCARTIMMRSSVYGDVTLWSNTIQSSTFYQFRTRHLVWIQKYSNRLRNYKWKCHTLIDNSQSWQQQHKERGRRCFSISFRSQCVALGLVCIIENGKRAQKLKSPSFSMLLVVVPHHSPARILYNRMPHHI